MRWGLVFLAALIAGLSGTAFACEPAGPHLARLAASGWPSESFVGEEMERIVAALHEHIDFDEKPTRVIVHMTEPRAAVWLLVGDYLCEILHGPAAGVRAIVAAAKGQDT